MENRFGLEAVLRTYRVPKELPWLTWRYLSEHGFYAIDPRLDDKGEVRIDDLQGGVLGVAETCYGRMPVYCKTVIKPGDVYLRYIAEGEFTLFTEIDEIDHEMIRRYRKKHATGVYVHPHLILLRIKRPPDRGLVR